MCSKIRFHVYKNVSRCTMHSQRPQEERTIFSLCYTYGIYVNPGELYTHKDLVLLETSISEFHYKYFTPDIP